MFQKILLAIFLFTTVCAAHAQNKKIDSLWKLYRECTETEIKCETILLQIAQKYTDEEQKEAADSLYAIITEKFEANGNDTQCLEVYKQYFNRPDLISNERSREYLSQMFSLAKKHNDDSWLYEAYKSKYKVSYTEDNPQEALKNIELAFYHANQTGIDSLRAECLLYKGDALVLNGNKIEAFRHYMDAGYLIEKIKIPSFVTQYDSTLSRFYFLIRSYEKAREYKKKQLQILLSSPPVDSTRLMRLNIDFATIFWFDDKPIQAKKMAIAIIDFAIRNKKEGLKKAGFTLYRTCLIDRTQFTELADLYIHKYPEEFEKTKREDTALYYRLQAYIYEASEKADSAFLSYNLAEKYLSQKSEGGYQLSNFYKRFGQFLLRNEKPNLAADKFYLAYQYAKNVNYLPFIIETAHVLDSVNLLLKRTDTAYYYAQLFYKYSLRFSEENNQEELLRLEVDGELKKRELEQEVIKTETDRRHNIQYMGMVIAITASFIILAILGTFKVHRFMIRAMGFFTFIFFFEFIVLLVDDRIHDFTHGEPWMIIAFKIVIIGFLLPLHHWIEEKVVHYLSTHKLIDTSKFSFRRSFLIWKKKPATIAASETEKLIEEE